MSRCASPRPWRRTRANVPALLFARKGAHERDIVALQPEHFALQRARPGARRRGSPREDRLGEAAMLARRPRVPAKPSRAVRVRSVPLRGAVKVTKCRQ